MCCVCLCARVFVYVCVCGRVANSSFFGSYSGSAAMNLIQMYEMGHWSRLRLQTARYSHGAAATQTVFAVAGGLTECAAHLGLCVCLCTRMSVCLVSAKALACSALCVCESMCVSKCVYMRGGAVRCDVSSVTVPCCGCVYSMCASVCPCVGVYSVSIGV